MLKTAFKNFNKARFLRYYSNPHTLNEIPLNKWFPATPSITEIQPQASQMTTAKLPNGIKLVGETLTSRIAPSVISVRVETGSRYETYENSGTSHFIQRFFFSATNVRTRVRLVTELQKTGALVSASAGREEIVYRAECLQEAVPRVFELLSDSILSSRLIEYDMPPHREEVKLDLEHYAMNPKMILNEALHQTAFNGKTLGRPLLCPPHQVELLKAKQIVEFMDEYYTPERITITANNFPIEDLSKLAMIYYGTLEPGKMKEKETPVYTGGDCQMHEYNFEDCEAKVYTAIGFKGEGSETSRSCHALNVLAAILGEGSNKYTRSTLGKASILHRNVVSKDPGLHEAKAYNTIYSDAGLFSVFLSGENGKSIRDGIYRVLEEIHRISQNLDDETFERAFNRVKFLRESSKESTSGLNEYMSTIVNRPGLEDISTSPSEVKKAAENLLNNKITLVSYGYLKDVPTTHDIKL